MQEKCYKMDLNQENSTGNLPKFFQAASAIEIYKFINYINHQHHFRSPFCNLRKNILAGKRQYDGYPWLNLLNTYLEDFKHIFDHEL